MTCPCNNPNPAPLRQSRRSRRAQSSDRSTGSGSVSGSRSFSGSGEEYSQSRSFSGERHRGRLHHGCKVYAPGCTPPLSIAPCIGPWCSNATINTAKLRMKTIAYDITFPYQIACCRTDFNCCVDNCGGCGTY